MHIKKKDIIIPEPRDYFCWLFWYTSFQTFSKNTCAIFTSKNGAVSYITSPKVRTFKILGNGNPFQYSCLENPMEGGAWWATVHGVAKSRTRGATSLQEQSSFLVCFLVPSRFFRLEDLLTIVLKFLVLL